VTRLPCPSWCVVNHDLEEADREPWNDIYGHRGVDVYVPAMAPDGGDDPDRIFVVGLTAVDDSDGSRSPVGVWLEAGGTELSPERAVQFATAILNAALAAGGQLDQLSNDGGGVR
jgi:hypothetical protein